MSYGNEVDPASVFRIERRVFHPDMPETVRAEAEERAEAILAAAQAAITQAGVGEWWLQKKESLYIPIVGKTLARFALSRTAHPTALNPQSIFDKIRTAPTSTTPVSLTVHNARTYRPRTGVSTQVKLVFERKEDMHSLNDPDLEGVYIEQELGAEELEAQSKVRLNPQKVAMQIAHCVDPEIQRANLHPLREAMTANIAALGPIIFQPPDFYT